MLGRTRAQRHWVCKHPELPSTIADPASPLAERNSAEPGSAYYSTPASGLGTGSRS